MDILFSPSLDSFSSLKIISISSYLSSIDDWEECEDELLSMFYYKTLEVPEGKRRKVGTLELEDIPPKSTDELFSEEMNAINNRYKSDTKAAIEKVSSAIGWDGATEGTKVANARAELYQLKENYDTQPLAIINKYYGA